MYVPATVGVNRKVDVNVAPAGVCVSPVTAGPLVFVHVNVGDGDEVVVACTVTVEAAGEPKTTDWFAIGLIVGGGVFCVTLMVVVAVATPQMLKALNVRK